MKKFLKLTFSDAPTLIPVDRIMGVEIGADTVIKVYMEPGFLATGASQVMGYSFTATTASDTAKTKEQLTALVDQLENGMKESWQSPFITLNLPYAVTAVAQIEDEWSA